MEHAWCRDTERDDAVRAAEDNRNGRLPTLREAIAQNFADAAERPSTASKTGEGQSGLRTERIVLEIQTHSPLPVSEWGWQEIVEDSNVKMVAFSVRVVEDQRESHLSHLEAQRGVIDTLTRQRDAAIREREIWRALYQSSEAGLALLQMELKDAEKRVAELESDA